MKELTVVLLLSVLVACLAKDTAVTLNEATSTNHCDTNEEVAKVCGQCSSLPFDVYTPSAACCSVKNAFLFCEACVKDQKACKTLMEEIEEANSFSEEQYDDVDDYYDESEDYDDDTGVSNVDKRFGKLFVTSPKRYYGRLVYGKRGDDGSGYFDKRYGRLYMGSGSYFGKRGEDMDKRFGRLYMNSNSMFGKRGDDAEELDDADMEDVDVDKRYGRVYMSGNRYNKLFGKRDGVVDKRYGRIFMGRNGLFGKRDIERDFRLDNPWEIDDLEKRYGQLYINRNRYNMRPKVATIGKRFGRLFTGRRKGKYLFG